MKKQQYANAVRSVEIKCKKTANAVPAVGEIDNSTTAAKFARKLPHNVHNLARIVEAMQGRLAIVPEEHPDDPHCQFIEFDN